MFQPQLSQIAQRMHQGLLRELGQGLDVQQLLVDARYARDVLLACDGFADNELSLLSAQFRRVAADDGSDRHDGFAATGPSTLPAADAVDSRPSRRWNNPSSWFGA